jgi:hypothetical protein
MKSGSLDNATVKMVAEFIFMVKHMSNSANCFYRKNVLTVMQQENLVLRLCIYSTSINRQKENLKKKYYYYFCHKSTIYLYVTTRYDLKQVPCTYPMSNFHSFSLDLLFRV